MIIHVIIITLFSEGDISTYKVKVQNMSYLQMTFKTKTKIKKKHIMDSF